MMLLVAEPFIGWGGPPGKIKKSTIIGLFCEILYNFMSVLGFG